MTTTDVKLDTVENSIKDVLINNCKKSLISFKEENRIPLKDDKGDDMGFSNEGKGVWGWGSWWD